jgi:hypothetical protein
MRTLAERFPNDVRLRQSMLRDRIPTPPPIHAAATVLGPHASGSVQPSVPMGTPIAVPPMATPMATPAPLTMAPPRQRKTGLIIALALVVAVGGITFGVIWSMRGQDKPSQPGSASGSAPVVASATPDAAAVAPPTIDAVVAHASDPTPEPIDAASPPIDAAAPPDGPKKDARWNQQGHPVPEKKPKGMLHVSALPALTVWVDDKQIRSTPLDFELSVGHHKIRLTNDELGHDETVHVNIVEGKTTNIDRSNWKN